MSDSTLTVARQTTAQACSALYALVRESPVGSPARVAFVEKYCAVGAILFGLFPLETLRGVHIAAEGRLGARLTQASHDEAVLAHQQAMVDLLSGLSGLSVQAGDPPLDFAAAVAIARLEALRSTTSLLQMAHVVLGSGTVPPDRTVQGLRAASHVLQTLYPSSVWLAANRAVMQRLELVRSDLDEAFPVTDELLVPVLTALVEELGALDPTTSTP